jgi:hypothetical protein
VKKRAYIFIGIVTIVLIGGFAMYSSPTKTLAKCPSDYGTDDAGSAEYLAATNKWTNDFFDAHPDATLADWANARHQFWIDNNCTKELKGYEESKMMQS